MSGFEALIGAIPSWAGTAAAIGGTVLQASAARSAGKAEAAAAEFNARQSQLEAQSRERAQRAEADRRLGTIRAQIGKSGATSAGTPLMVLAESAANAEIDALNTRFTGLREQALYRSQGQNARKQGNLAAGTSLLSGFGRIM